MWATVEEEDKGRGMNHTEVGRSNVGPMQSRMLEASSLLSNPKSRLSALRVHTRLGY